MSSETLLDQREEAENRHLTQLEKEIEAGIICSPRRSFYPQTCAMIKKSVTRPSRPFPENNRTLSNLERFERGSSDNGRI